MLDEAREKVVSQYGEDHNRDARRAMEQEGVKVSLANLRTFPCVREKEGNGELRLVGAYFAIADGLLHVLDEQSGVFSPARSEEHTSELQSLMRISYAVFC